MAVRSYSASHGDEARQTRFNLEQRARTHAARARDRPRRGRHRRRHGGSIARALIDARRLDDAATWLAADIQLARSEAMARNRSLRLSVFAAANATCWIVHTGTPADCRCDADTGAACSGDAHAIRSVVLPAIERVGLSANVASIAFDPLHGTSTPTGTLRLTGPRVATHHVVNVVGRVRSCSPGGAAPGYSAC